MKMLLAIAVLPGLVLGTGTAYAAAVETTPSKGLAVVEHGRTVGGRALIQNTRQTLELSGANLVLVLGGGLIAVSLVARRKSS